jgi:ankyrin repeat protein
MTRRHQAVRFVILAAVTLATVGVAQPLDLPRPASMWTPESTLEAIRVGGDVNAHDANGLTPLMRAAWHNENPAVVRVLLDAGANLEAHDRGGGTALMYAARLNANPDVLRVLVNAGANLEGECPVFRGHLIAWVDSQARRSPHAEDPTSVPS